jgi:hypothetical protein
MDCDCPPPLDSAPVARLYINGRRTRRPISAMKHLTRTDIQLIETVQAHLKQLATVAVFNADEPTLRMVTGTLRALLVEEMLQRAWRTSGLGGPITFKTYCIVSTQGDDVVAYCGGGDLIPNIPISWGHNAHVAERTLNLKDFCRQTRIQIGTATASTIDIVKYVANALGGSHFDPDGKTARKFDLLRRIESGEIGQLFLQANNRNALHHELLSIAQSVTRSPQVHQLSIWSAPSGTGNQNLR